MLKIIKAEHLKLSHTFGKKFAVIAPGLILLLAIPLTAQQAGMTWSFSICVWNWWYTMFLPGMLSVFCYLIIKKDKKIKYHNMLLLHVPLELSWLGKIIYSSLVLVCSNFVIFLGTTAAGGIFGTVIPLKNGFFAAFLLCISCLWMIPLLLFLSARFGAFVSILTGNVLFLCGTVSLADTGLWWVFPASIPMRLMCPILGIQPNGLLIPEGSELFDRNVILPGILLSVLWFIGMTFFTTLWFKRKGAES